MSKPKYPAMKDRRDIGEVVFPIEKMLAARELSSCCVGVEAALEINAKSIKDRLKDIFRGNSQISVTQQLCRRR